MDTVGQIKINIGEAGQSEVIITGDIPRGFMSRSRRTLAMAYRKHVAGIRRAAEKVDMSDKGTKLADLKPEKLEQVNEPKPNPDIELKMPPTPDMAPVQDQFVPDGDDVEVEEANNPNESEEKKDGTIEEAGRVHRDDEEQGGAGSTFGFDK